MASSTRQARKIRVLCVGRDLAGGGAERVQLTLLERLDRSRFEIKLFYLQDRGCLRDLIPSDLTPVYGVGERQSPKLAFFSIASKLVAMARESDLVFGMMQGTPTYMAALAGRIARRPVVGWMHSVWSKEVEMELPWWHRPASRLLYPLVDSFLAVSEGAAGDLRAFAPSVKERVTCVRNFLAIRETHQLADEELPSWAEKVFEKRVLLGVGRLVPAKGFDLLIAAFAKLLVAGYDLNLVILGEGPQRERLEQQARTLGVADRLYMPGFVENPYPFLRHSEVFVLSSRQEGFGMVLLEALALGTCVVSSDCPHGPRSILDGGRYGVLVPPEDIGSLAEGISSILKDPMRRSRCRTLGQQYAAAFDAPRSVSYFGELLCSLVAERGTRS